MPPLSQQGRGAPAPLCCEGVYVQRQPAAGQDAVVGPLAGQQRLDHRGHEVNQLRRLGIHALAQRGTQGQQGDAQRLLEEHVATEVLDGVEVALALHEQAKVAANNVAVGHAALDRQGSIEPSERGLQGQQVVADQGQASYRREVVVELLDDQLAMGAGLGNTEIDTPAQLTRRVIRCQVEPC